MNKRIDLYQKSGFTLIEMLVVISIIGVLAAIALVSFTGTQKQARDTERKSDLRQYQTALEGFASKQATGMYPSYTTEVEITTANLCDVARLNLSGCPQDPKDTTPYLYKYRSNGSGSGGATATTYFLWTALESKPATTYWVLCSDGKIGEYTGAIGASCPL